MTTTSNVPSPESGEELVITPKHANNSEANRRLRVQTTLARWLLVWYSFGLEKRKHQKKT